MNIPGAGAAGGLGFAFLAYVGATLTPGIELILDAVGLEDELSGADVVVTGEGRLARNNMIATVEQVFRLF